MLKGPKRSFVVVSVVVLLGGVESWAKKFREKIVPKRTKNVREQNMFQLEQNVFQLEQKCYKRNKIYSRIKIDFMWPYAT